MNFFSKILFFASALFMASCAASYKPINPTRIHYSTDLSQDGIIFSYKYDVLQERGNKKYAKKEQLKGVKLVAVKISNNTDDIVDVGRDIIFYAGSRPVTPLDPAIIKNSIKQIVPAYLPYLLLSFMTLNVYNGTTTSSYPIGLLLGPGLALGNMATAGTANKNMEAELVRYDIINQQIKKGETVYGIIGIYESGFNPMSIRLKEQGP